MVSISFSLYIPSTDSYTAQLKSLFWIAVSNFVFPVILSIIQLILLFHDPSYLKGAYIFMANDYVEIIGVLLATVWTTSKHWTDKHTTSTSHSTSIETTPHFASKPRHTGSGTAGTGIEVDDSSIEGDIESHRGFTAQEKGRRLGRY